MNIVIKTSNGCICCRPDTTWERENKDFFSPDFVKNLLWSPVLFARIGKAGKYINPKYVERYFDGVNFGMLLYPGEIYLKDGYAPASILDHTSILPFPLFNPSVIKNGNIATNYLLDNQEIFRLSSNSDQELFAKICDGICDASRHISLRIGDMVAIELANPSELVSGKGNEKEISGTFCENETFRFKIKL